MVLETGGCAFQNCNKIRNITDPVYALGLPVPHFRNHAGLNGKTHGLNYTHVHFLLSPELKSRYEVLARPFKWPFMLLNLLGTWRGYAFFKHYTFVQSHSCWEIYSIFVVIWSITSFEMAIGLTWTMPISPTTHILDIIGLLRAAIAPFRLLLSWTYFPHFIWFNRCWF